MSIRGKNIAASLVNVLLGACEKFSMNRYTPERHLMCAEWRRRVVGGAAGVFRQGRPEDRMVCEAKQQSMARRVRDCDEAGVRV